MEYFQGLKNAVVFEEVRLGVEKDSQIRELSEHVIALSFF
jgi:hypothetical protein